MVPASKEYKELRTGQDGSVVTDLNLHNAEAVIVMVEPEPTACIVSRPRDPNGRCRKTGRNWV